MKVKLLHDKAKAPVRGSEFAAGYDLFTVDNVIISPKQRCKLSTGIAIEIPFNRVAIVKPRSKLADRFGIDILAGVIDSDYRGEVMISLINHGDRPFEVRCGDKVAQLLINKVDMNEVEIVDRLTSTNRGTKGINSTELRLR